MSETAKSSRGIEIFVLSSHRDQELRQALETHLALLKREKLVAWWHDEEIEAGADWGVEIRDRLLSADIVLILVSPDLLASDHVWDAEMPQAMARHASGEALVIPVILRPVDWQGTPLAKLQALPEDARPVTSWENVDEAFLDIARGLRAVIEERLRQQDRLESLEIEHFSVFETVRLDFSPGLNVLIGLNSTGKSHLMKLAYALLPRHGGRPEITDGRGVFEEDLRRKIVGLFQPEEGKIERLIRRAQEEARVRLRSELGALEIGIRRGGSLELEPLLSTDGLSASALFIPSRETLAMYEGFAAAYERRELSFDKTYFDLCEKMSASPLRSGLLNGFEEVLRGLESLLGGRVRLRGNRFYVEAGEHVTEAHLLAEGLRKIAVLAHLIQNGSLTKNTVLFWDEPEANLHPSLIVELANLLHRLAEGGVQIILATHDYLLAHELSLKAEHTTDETTGFRFFSFYRDAPEEGVRIESGAVLAEIEHNPILEEYAIHHEREQLLMQKALST